MALKTEDKPGKAEAKTAKTEDCTHCLPLPDGKGHVDVRSYKCSWSTRCGCGYERCQNMVVPDGVSPEGFLSCAEHRGTILDGVTTRVDSGILTWQMMKPSDANANCVMDPKVMDKLPKLAEHVLPHAKFLAQLWQKKVRRWLARISLMKAIAERASTLEARLLGYARKEIESEPYGSDDDQDAYDYITFNPEFSDVE
jgi:hypothetical protein